MAASEIKAKALEYGFSLCGITSLGPVESSAFFDEWIARGHAGEMGYLPRGAEKRRDTRLPYEGVKSAVVVALEYGGRAPSGTVARYARSDDYHDVMLDRLNELHAWINQRAGTPIKGKAYVDTGPILERDLARRAGLGWFGKNTNLVNPKIGSFFFIGALLLDMDLEQDVPFETDHCGTCTRCLDACPTGAFTAPRELDARKCISYLTIELKGSIPEPLRDAMGEHIYGCDICQDVCPWNIKFAQDLSKHGIAHSSDLIAPDPCEIVRMTEDDFRARFKKSPIKRTKRRGLARNAAVALGNRGAPGDEEALREAVNDPDPVVREHAEWGLRKIVTNK